MDPARQRGGHLRQPALHGERDIRLGGQKVPRNRQAQGIARFSYTIAVGANPKIVAEAGEVIKN